MPVVIGELFAWLQLNWMPVLVALLSIDTVLIGIFPNVPFFGSIKGILQWLTGNQPPPPPASLK